MSIARHHNEWLSLLEVSGPFLSLPVLLKVFPQGLEEQDSEARKNLRIAHDEWEADGRDPAIHTAWLEFVLGTALEYPECRGRAMKVGYRPEAMVGEIASNVCSSAFAAGEAQNYECPE